MPGRGRGSRMTDKVEITAVTFPMLATLFMDDPEAATARCEPK